MRHLHVGLFVACSLCSRSTFAQNLDQPIEYRTPAVSASQAASDLSKLAKFPIQVDAPLDGWPLILRLNHVPLSKALDQICAVMHASWTKGKSAITISRTPDVQEALDEKNLERTRKNVKEVLDRTAAGLPGSAMSADKANALLSEAGHLDLTNEDNSQKIMVDAGDSSTCLAARLAPYIDPEILVQQSNNPYVVFSTSPKPLQHPLNISPEDLQAILDEQKQWYDFEVKLGKLMPADQNHFDDPKASYNKRLDAANAKVIVTYNGGELEVYILDQTGAMWAYGVTDENYSDDDEKPTEIDKQGFKPVKLNPLSQEFISLYRAGQNASAPSPKLKEFLLHPDVHDPLSLACSDVFLGAADQKDLNLAACPSDNLARPPYQTDSMYADPKTFLTEEAGQGEVKFEDGWLLVACGGDGLAERSRVNRKDLANLMAAYNGDEPPSLDDLSTFAANNPNMPSTLTANMYLKLLKPGEFNTLARSYRMLRLWGTLTDQQRKILLAGQSIDMSNLPTEALRFITEELSNYGGFTSDDPDTTSMVAKNKTVMPEDKWWNYTELPNGLNGSVRLQALDSQLYVTKSVRPPHMISQYRLANDVMASNGNLLVSVLPMTTYNLMVDLQPDLSLRVNAVLPSGPAANFVPYADLSEELQKAVSEHIRLIQLEHLKSSEDNTQTGKVSDDQSP